MSDIDLIPQAYRTRRWQALWTRRAVILTAGLSAALLITWGVVGMATAALRSDVTLLQNQLSHSAQQRSDIERLTVEKTELEGQFRLLTNLRSGAAAGDMFVTIDSALDGDDVWFREVRLQRAGAMVRSEEKTVNTGYFVVVPEGERELDADKIRIQTNMEIRGQALDHSALSGFVRRLFVQPDIDDIRIRRTSLVDRTLADTLDFELDVVLKTDVSVQ